MERNYAVHSVNPRQLDRFRGRLSPSSAKDGRRDAQALAISLRTDPHCFRKLCSNSAEMVELRELGRISDDQMLQILKVPAFPVAPGTTQAVCRNLKITFEQLETINRQCREVAASIESTIQRLTEAEEDEPGNQDPSK